MNNLDFAWNQPQDNILIERFHTFFEVKPEYQHLITDSAIVETFHNIYQEFEESEYSVQWFIDMAKRIRNTTVREERDHLIKEFKNARDQFLFSLPILDFIEELYQPLLKSLRNRRLHLEDAIRFKGDEAGIMRFEDHHILYFLTPNLAGLVDSAAAEIGLEKDEINNNMSATEIIEYLKYFKNTQGVVKHNPHYNLFDDLVADEQNTAMMEGFAQEYHQTIDVISPDFSIAES